MLTRRSQTVKASKIVSSAIRMIVNIVDLSYPVFVSRVKSASALVSGLS
jgi:hypothetical protein